MAGGAQDRIRLYTTEGGWLHLPTEALIEDALRAKADGFGGSKVKVGRPVAEDVARLRRLREAVGAGFEIFTDANQAFTVDEAIRRARLYEAADIGWFEEPLPADDVDGHVRLSRATTIPIAVGESLYSLAQFRDYLQRGACSIVQVDVARIGGITPWLKTAHLAEAFNVAVCPHFLMELHVALCCAVPNSRWLEYIPQLDDLTTAPMRIRDGHADAERRAGPRHRLGFRGDRAADGRGQPAPIGQRRIEGGENAAHGPVQPAAAGKGGGIQGAPRRGVAGRARRRSPPATSATSASSCASRRICCSPTGNITARTSPPTRRRWPPIR